MCRTICRPLCYINQLLFLWYIMGYMELYILSQSPWTEIPRTTYRFLPNIITACYLVRYCNTPQTYSNYFASVCSTNNLIGGMFVQNTRYTHCYSAHCPLISSAVLIINVFSCFVFYSHCRSNGIIPPNFVTLNLLIGITIISLLLSGRLESRL